MDDDSSEARMQSYQDLIAWQRGMDLVMAIHQATRSWPRDDQYKLTSQIRRAAVSIPSNLAEGHGRTGARELAHHGSIAFGSLCELETQLLIADRLGYNRADTTAQLASLTAEVRRLLRGLLRSLRNPASSG